MSEPTIFVLDDDEAVRDSLKALLESAGMAVKVYASGRQFLKEFTDLPSGACYSTCECRTSVA